MIKLKNPPIVEAMLNIDCDMPPGLDLVALQQPAAKAFQPDYPKMRAVYMQEHLLQATPTAAPKIDSKSGLHGLQLIREDEKQLVQIRSNGFSFHRLAPYTSLDDYLKEIEKTFTAFIGLASPIQTRLIQLRYINRILLPFINGKINLEEYFKICPKLPDEERLTFVGFLNQHNAIENETGNHVSIILTTQLAEKDTLPIIFDVTATRPITVNPKEMDGIVKIIQSLRDLKNRVFQNTSTTNDVTCRRRLCGKSAVIIAYQ